MKNVNYFDKTTPDDYRCSKCNATGCKLWRETGVFTPQLRCASCICQSKGYDIKIIDPETGKYPLNTDYKWAPIGQMSDQVGGYVPAVPDEQGVGYWGYSSVPQDGVNWWKRLPLLRGKYKTTG